jgi:hypothetical protein
MPSSIKRGTVYMYADDTTVYVIGKSIDKVTVSLNLALSDLYTWCTANSLTPRPTKCEAMLLHRGSFHGPINCLNIGKNAVKWVNSTRLLGVILDNKLNCFKKYDWYERLDRQYQNNFTKKLNNFRRN